MIKACYRIIHDLEEEAEERPQWSDDCHVTVVKEVICGLRSDVKWISSNQEPDKAVTLS